MPRSFRWVPCESSSQIYGNQVRCGLFFKKNLQIEPAFAFYDNPLAQSRQLTELPAHQRGARRKLAALAPKPDSNSLFPRRLGFRRGTNIERAANPPHTREPTPKMSLSLLSLNSVIPFIKRADHRRDRAARIIYKISF